MKTLDTNLTALNSATKYPSILTYHKLGQKGRLTDERNIKPQSELIVTEKVDGTNTRVIFMPDGYFLIGSREHLLYARGDLIGNPALGIVESIKPLAERINACLARRSDRAVVAFFETYGGKTTGAAKNYTSDQSFGHRLFDVAEVGADTLELQSEAIASWRESRGQDFYAEEALQAFASEMEIDLTHRISASSLPTSHEAVLTWLETEIPATFAAIDDGAKGHPEGVVVRTPDRRSIAKIRFADYRRTLKIR